MPNPSSKISAQLLRLVVKPIAAYCVRNAIRFHEVSECLKVEMISAAKKALAEQDSRVNTSRLSVITGLQRREISSLESYPDSEGKDSEAKDIVARVMGRWQADPDFTTRNGKPRVIPKSDSEMSFQELVKRVSTDVNPASVLAELERTDTIRHTTRGLALQKASFVPKNDPEQLFSILSKDISDLTLSVEENTFEDSRLPQLHARTEYDKVRPEGLKHLREWFLTEGHRLHTKAREIISRYDQDVNPDPSFTGKVKKVVLGTFSYTEKSDRED